MKNYFILLFLFLGLNSFAQIVDIPDAVFKEYLVNETCVDADNNGTFEARVDTNNDGEIQLTEAQAVIRLQVRNVDASSIEGLSEFSNVEYLNFTRAGVTSINTNDLPQSLITYYATNDFDMVNIDLSGHPNLESFTSISANNILTLNLENCPNLQEANFKDTSVSVFSMSGLDSIEIIDAEDCEFTSFDISNNLTIKELNLGDNQLANINFGNNSALEILVLSNNNLTTITIPDLPNLDFLALYNNSLTSLNINSALPSLTDLSLFNNQLTTFSINNLNILEDLNLYNNQLTSLDVSNLTNLEDLAVSYNELSYLNITNLTSLNQLYVQNNNLSILDFTGTNNITYGVYEDNNFEFLDFSNATSTFAAVIDNNPNLTELYFRNGNNDNINGQAEQTSFENCPNLEYICIDDDELTDVQNLINTYGYTGVTISTSCPVTPGDTTYIVTGDVKVDTNSNGCNAADVSASFFTFEVSSGGTTGTFVSGIDGMYTLGLPQGQTTITPVLENPSIFTISPASLTVDFPDDDSPSLQDFCLTPVGTYQDISVTLEPIGIARPGFDTAYKVVVRNHGNTGVSGSVSLEYQATLMDFISATPAVNSQNGNILNWNYSNLAPFSNTSYEVAYNLNSPTDSPPVNNDDVLSFEAIVNPLSNDQTPLDNEMELSQIVVGSFDPNNIICLQGALIDIDEVGEFLHYQINFENLGTANAQDVRVSNFIDPTYFVLSSLQPIDGSAQFTTVQNGSSVSFNFDDIDLPFQEPNNTGFVTYRIKTNTNLTHGTEIENQANIFFDFNPAITTNVARTLIDDPLGLQENNRELAIKFIPNPAQDFIRLINNEMEPIQHVFIYNELGQVMVSLSNPREVIDVSFLTSGLYFAKVSVSSGDKIIKILKE